MSDPIADAPIASLLSAEDIATRVREMGEQISRDYDGLHPTLVCILKGSMPFFVDLGRAIDIPVRCDYLAVRSYEGTKSTGVVKFTADLSDPIQGRHVILVEDIIDTGLTMSYLLESLQTRQPASLRVATLLDKPSRRKKQVPIHYRGFEIDDHFVIGYGLDFDQYYRNLPYVGVLEEVPELPHD